jgi:hypothetical protein
VKATADAWQRQPFEDVVPIPYRRSFPQQAFERLQAGLVPRAMEDKWFVYYEAPHLYFHRSWTGLPVYRVEFKETGEGAEVSAAYWSTALAQAPAADPAHQARLLHFLISNLLLGESIPFPQPATMPAASAGLYQHHLAGTGYPETPADGSTPASTAASVRRRTTMRRLRDRISTLMTVGAAGIAGAAILLWSLLRRKPRRP